VRILAVNWQDDQHPQAGGAEIHLFEILERLAKRGNEVTLLCCGWPGAAQRQLHRGVDIHRTGSRSSFALHAPRYFRRELSRTPFDVILDDINKVPLCTPLWTGSTPVVALVPHLFGTTAFSELPAPLAAIVWLSERPLPIIYRHSLFHAISRSTADDLVSRGVRRDRISVIYPGIDSGRYTPDAERRSPTPLFAYLGRLKRYKGIDLILRAFAGMAVPGARLEIAGTGDFRPALERLALSLDLTDRVSFLGFVTEEQKLDLLRRAWSLVFTSPKEGWGITNLEAQACATPVIASDSPGLRESLQPGVSGLLVPHGNLQALSGALDSLAAAPETVSAMGLRGREFSRTFSWDRTAMETERHLSSAISLAAGGGHK